MLQCLFSGEDDAAECLDALDANDDGRLTAADSAKILEYLFKNGTPPPEPFEACGVDPTEDALTCGFYPQCR